MKKIALILLYFLPLYAQEAATSDFFAKIKNYDISSLLTADSIFVDDDNKKFKRPEILGFIGDNYQRLQIHFISIIKNQSNPYEYFAYGKTKVKGIIREFQGTIKITKSKVYKENVEGELYPNYKLGFAESEVHLYEDRKENSTGFFSGKLKTNFIIDPSGVFRYDVLMFVADGFSNNQFIGTWTSYTTKTTKKSNWGDYRIPESKELDVGAGEFSIGDKYVKNGWENYKLAWQTYPETDEVIKAREKEDEKWWE